MALYYGFHVSKVSKVLDKRVSRKTMSDAILQDSEIFEINYVQIFTHGPQNLNENKIDYDDVKKLCKKKKIGLVVHSSYLSTGIWNMLSKPIKKQNTYKWHIKSQAEACSKLDADGLVIHLPNNDKEDIASVLKHLEHELGNITILLEIENNNKYSDPLQLKELCLYLSDNIKSKWLICIDTAHIWSSQINIASKKDMKKWFDEFAYPQFIGLIHFNGSSEKFGSKKDKHAIPLASEDKIWGSYRIDKKISKSGAQYVIKYAKKNKIPLICEINTGSQTNVAQLMKTITS